MKKLLIMMLSLALVVTTFLAVVPAFADDVHAELEVQNLLDFEKTDYGKHSYNSETGTVKMAGGSGSARLFFSTVLPITADTQFEFTDGTTKSASEVTFVAEVTVKPVAVSTWQVPYLVFAKDGDDTYELHDRNGIGGVYVFARTGDADKSIVADWGNVSGTPIAVGDSYTVHMEFKAKTVSVKIVAKGNETRLDIANQTLDLPDGYTPVFGLGDREQKDTEFSNMKFYIKEGNIVIPEPEYTNLLNFGATSWGKNFYDDKTGEVMLYGDDTRVYIPTVVSSVTDGKVHFADGSVKDVSELTFGMEATITPGVMGSWTVPFLVFAKDGIDTYEFHFRAGMSGGTGTCYLFQRCDEVGNYTEVVKKELAVTGDPLPAGGSYTVRILYSGKKVSAKLIVNGQVYASCNNLEILPDEYTPVFSFGDRTNGETVISNMKWYIVSDTEVANYATGLTVKTAPAGVNYGEELSGGSFELTYMDGTTETLTLADLTVGGFDKNAVGKQTVSVTKTVLNQNVTAYFEAEVADVESFEVSVSKTEYEYNEEFDLSTVKVVKKYASGKDSEDVTVTASDFTVADYDKATSGEQTVKITYQGKDYTVKVIVGEKPKGCKSSLGVSFAAGAVVLIAVAAAAFVCTKKRAK